MKIIFVHGTMPTDDRLVAAVSTGLENGDEIESIADDIAPHELDCDYIALNGLRRMDWLEYCLSEHLPFLYFDKGYKRQEKEREWFWRVGLNETHPAEYIAAARHNPGRVTKLRKAMGLPERIPEWRAPTKDGSVIIASSSEKFHKLHGLPPPREWVSDTIREVRKHTTRPILYRPKPSWGDPGPIDGSRCVVDIKHMSRLFAGCHALITYGSYICVDAMLEGVPSIVLGNGVIRSISSSNLADLEEPRLASLEDRQQVLSNLAWTQYTADEWSKGYAWYHTKRLFLQ